LWDRILKQSREPVRYGSKRKYAENVFSGEPRKKKPKDQEMPPQISRKRSGDRRPGLGNFGPVGFPVQTTKIPGKNLGIEIFQGWNSVQKKILEQARTNSTPEDTLPKRKIFFDLRKFEKTTQLALVL